MINPAIRILFGSKDALCLDIVNIFDQNKIASFISRRGKDAMRCMRPGLSAINSEKHIVLIEEFKQREEYHEPDRKCGTDNTMPDL